jgi:hypothetical protein
MRGKLLFIAGGLTGYVLGARAGRQRYEQIRAAAKDLWNAQPVQRRVSEVRDFALDAVGDVPMALYGTAKKLISSAASTNRGSAPTTPSAVPGSEPAYGTD